MRPRGGFLVFTVAILASSRARAQGNEGSLIERGLELRRQHRDPEALELFRRAHETDRTPRALAQLALAEQALAQWVEAERDLRGALAVADDPWIAGHRGALEAALDVIESHLATLSVSANVATGEVWLNGNRVSQLPLVSARVPAGSVRVEVRSKAYEPAHRAIELAPRAIATEDVQLTPLADPQRTAKTPLADSKPASERSSAGIDASASVVHSTASPTRWDGERRAFAWGALGAASAFLSGAIVAQVVREERASKYNDDGRCLYGELSRDERCGVYRGQAESAQALANVAYVAAGGLGIASAILFLVNPAKSTPLGMSAWLGVGASGLRLDIAGKL